MMVVLIDPIHICPLPTKCHSHLQSIHHHPHPRLTHLLLHLRPRHNHPLPLTLPLATDLSLIAVVVEILCHFTRHHLQRFADSNQA